MKKSATLCFLWHMHQPYYKDTLNNTYLMPWVRLHATKGYYDIPLAMEKFGIKGCVNIVPSLIEQIEDYLTGTVSDKWKDYTLRHPEELSDEEKAFVIKNFFMLCWDRLVKTSPRYFEILSKRERYVGKLSWLEMTKFFTPDEILDLQVHFNLKWFGFMAREHYPLLTRLDEKERRYSQEEKIELMKIQEEILRSIIPLYKRLSSEGKIELSFTPFYHPIFPLVYDTDISRRPTPSAPMPPRYSWPDDATWHLTEGKRYAEEHLGGTFSGMWPAEGSVAPELVPVAVEAGINWFATDEGILFRSVGNSNKGQVLYKPWAVEHNGKRSAVFFRDKYISDLIGFAFSKMEAEKAVESFMQHLRGAAFSVPDEHAAPVVSVILDGENAWENYPNNGRDFLFTLFDKLSQSKDIVPATFSEVLTSQPVEKMPLIHTLASGSWINSDYMIWIGNEEDNTAWDYLRRTRRFLADYLAQHPELPVPTRDEAMRAIYRAEGSDWFWWYGDQFSTENDYLFDRLFRRHLRKVYTVLGITAPTYLETPIKLSSRQEFIVAPENLVTPVISGREDSFYDWTGAGMYDNQRRPGGSMYNSIRVIKELWYGFDDRNLFFKIKLFDPLMFHEHKRYTMRCFLKDSTDFDFSLPIVRFEKTSFSLFASNESGKLGEIVASGTAAADEVLEIMLPYDKTGIRPGQKLSCYIKLFSPDGLEVERIPEVGMISIAIPDDRFLTRMWDV